MIPIEIPLGRLHPDPRNANVCGEETLQKLVQNIQWVGEYQPLVVRPHPGKKKSYIIIDGHHRVQALERLQKEEAKCLVWDVNEEQAGMLLVTLNRLRGEDVPRKRAELLQSLTGALGQEELLRLIPESREELNDLVSLLQLQEEEMERQIREAIRKDEEELPVIINFVMSKSEAGFVQGVLSRFQGESDDPTKALVAICLEVNNEEEKNESR